MNDKPSNTIQSHSYSQKSDEHAINDKQSVKRKYQKPTVKSEALNSYGAICNGTTNGGRKASAIAPNFCNARRLNS
jgi:hypothetical protein